MVFRASSMRLRIGNVALGVKRDVEVAADQHSLAGNVDIFNGLLVEIVHGKHSFTL